MIFNNKHIFKILIILALITSERINAKSVFALIHNNFKDSVIQTIQISEFKEQNKKNNINFEELANSKYNSKNYKDALNCLKMHRAYLDSIYQENINNSVSELIEKFENKQNIIDLIIQKKDKELLDVEIIKKKEYIKRRYIVILIVFIISMALLIFFIIFYKLFKKKNPAKIEQAQQNDNIKILNRKINNQYKKIENQRNELTKHKNLVEKQLELISKQKSEIDNNLMHAKIIKNAVQPSEIKLKEFFNNYYLIHESENKPDRNFYWLNEQGNKKYFALANSVNSGVSSVLISLLAISVLNDLINQKMNYSADELLNQMRKTLVRSLKLNEKTEQDKKDAVDIALCIYNKENRIIEFAGANLPFIIISGENVKIYDPDKMPVGISSRMVRKFRIQKTEINNDSIIVLISHGFRKMFSQDELLNHFTSIKDLSLIKQKEKLNLLIDNKIKHGFKRKDIMVLGACPE